MKKSKKLRIEEVKRAIGAYTPTEVKLESPEELERVAKALKKRLGRNVKSY